MSPEEEARLLAGIRDARRRSEELKEQAKAVQQNAVSAALSAGVSPLSIAAELGITKARVYQIRDGR